jgi:hypothetical protein
VLILHSWRRHRRSWRSGHTWAALNNATRADGHGYGSVQEVIAVSLIPRCTRVVILLCPQIRHKSGSGDRTPAENVDSALVFPRQPGILIGCSEILDKFLCPTTPPRAAYIVERLAFPLARSRAVVKPETATMPVNFEFTPVRCSWPALRSTMHTFSTLANCCDGMMRDQIAPDQINPIR